MKIAGIVGSLRKDSFNKKLMRAVGEHLPEGMDLEILEIGDIPLFNQDFEQNYPEAPQTFKDKIKESDGVIFATPEYNRTIPGVLKNAIDWASRPYIDNAFDGKPALVLGATNGQVGTALAQYNLKQALLYLNMRVLGKPEFYMSGAGKKFNEGGSLVDEDTIKFLENTLQTFKEFIG